MVKSKKASKTEVLKISLVRTDNGLVIQRVDMVSGKVVSNIELPKTLHHNKDDDQIHDSINECIEDYQKTDEYGNLMAQANRTCTMQYPHVRCC